MGLNLEKYRNAYAEDKLIEDNLPANPLLLFESWFEAALKADVYDANAMVLSTASEGKPSSRVVLLKALDENGFVFYTNYHSRKGRELAANENAALNFFWPALQKQIRIEGVVEKVAAERSEAYFNSRPFESRVSAVVSPQSEPVASRSFLEDKQKQYMQKPKSISRPAHWGGYCLWPNQIEFWQGRPDRLHDRMLYTKAEAGWTRQRLAP